MENSYVMIYAEIENETVDRKAFSQYQVYLICEQLSKDGAINIRYDFDLCDSLPKGV